MNAVDSLLSTVAAEVGCDERELQRFSDHLARLDGPAAARINPLLFAEAASLSPQTAVDLFVRGAKHGLFDLEWGSVCPLCGAITHSAPRIDGMAAHELLCRLCNKEVPAALDDTVEVTFAFARPDVRFDRHADFATHMRYHVSASYPYRAAMRDYHLENKVADALLAPGETGVLRFRAAPGEYYRLACLDIHAGAELPVSGDGKAGAMIHRTTLSPEGFSERELPLTAGTVEIAVTNASEETVWVRAFRLDMAKIGQVMAGGPPEFGPRLTGKSLINNQTFRDSFALSELAPDLNLKLRSITLLFTDLKGSTALYDRQGDLAAYRLVQDHFIALKQAVRGHEGAMIKTMGDAVMAAFPHGRDGVRAAVEMMAAMRTLEREGRGDEVGLKVGLHAGPALAINAGNTVDYFGQTVNIAARVQGMADAGDICITRSMHEEGDVPALLGEAGYVGRRERARLKGVSAAEDVVRYSLAG